MTGLSNDNFRIYLKLHVQKGFYYASIRLVNKHDKKTIDISVYLPNGQRLKLTKGSIKDNKIHKGFNTTDRNHLNAYLDELKDKVNKYTFYKKIVTKQEIEGHIYGYEFLESNQRKRSITLSLPVTKSQPTDYTNSIRSLYPKRRETIEIFGVDEEGFQTVDKKETIIDPLSPTLKDWPNNFPLPLYNKFKKEALSTLPIDQQQKFEQEENLFFLNQFIYFYITTKKVFNTPVVDHYITVDKPTIKEIEKQTGKKYEHASHVPPRIKNKLINKQLERNLTLTPTEEIYNKGLFDVDNIFEVFGSIYYDKSMPETYEKILVRLLEYREHKRPKEHIRDLNAQWLINFFTFLNENGWYTINTRYLDPLKYDRSIFFQKKERQPYKPKSLNKLIGITKTLINGTAKFTLNKKGLLPKLDLTELKLSAITDQKDLEGTRIEHNLNKDEFDLFYWFEFDKKKLKEYQKVFDRINKSKTVKITIEDLIIAKQLFVLQTMIGGLRGWKELATAKILKHNKTTYKISFYQNKVSNTVTNPLNAYTEGILKPLGYILPELKRVNAHKSGVKVTNDELKETHYRALLKTIGHIINFDRDVITDKVKYISNPIKEIFNPYFSRKTFGTILSQNLGLHDSDIELFTGHKGEKTMLSSNYIQKDTIENKIKLISGLKIGKKPVVKK